MAKSSKTAKEKGKNKAKKGQAKKQVKKREAEATAKHVKGIVRIAGKDLKGDLKLERALLYIKGIGHSLRRVIANTIEKELGIPADTPIGELDYQQIESINNVLFNLNDSKIPAFLLNRRKDFLTGENKHLIMNDLIFAQRQSIEMKKKIRSWQGYRHMRGKKVRGQRTKNTGRKGRAVGVSRKKK